jgi:PEGA domain
VHRFVIPILLFTFALSSFGADKARVFVTDSQSWEMSGSSGGSRDGFGGHTSGGARPQTAEIVKTFTERCPDVVVNNIREKADYVTVLDHEGGKGMLRKDNKVAVFNKDGDSIVSKSTRSLGTSVQEACTAIVADFAKRGSVTNAALKEGEPASSAAASSASAATESNGIVKAMFAPDVKGADIEVDGAFVGTTPSTVDLTPGVHDIKISKSGYKPWQRKMKVSGGSINVAPQLEGM